MAKFTAEYKRLTLQDEKGVWARFVDGELETDDKALIARLRSAEHVTEVGGQADQPSQ